MSKRFPDKKIVVVMPAYKAEKTLRQTVAAIPKDCIDEMILVDDASPDRTVEVAHELGIDMVIRHPKNRGYGGNQKTCYETALARGADIVVMVHPDYQYDPIFIPHLCQPLVDGTADAVFGSRMLVMGGALAGGMPWWKFSANIALTLTENIVLGLHLSEFHSGFRAYSRKTLETVPFEQDSDDFVFDTEIIVQLRVAKLRIKETPIFTHYFPEASMVGFWRSCEYGFAILGVLGEYVLFRMKLFSYAKFSMLGETSASCPLCHSAARQLAYGSTSKKTTTGASYTITEHSLGLSQTLYHCHSCDHVFTTDRVDSEELQKLYADQDLDVAYIAEEQGRRTTARALLAQLATCLPQKGRLIDIGSGYGFFLAEAKEAGWDASGIELGDASSRFARERGLTVTQGSWHELSKLPDESVDAITFFDVIEHLDEPDAFLALVSNKLKPGGFIVLTAPNRSSFFARLTGTRWHAYLPSHLHYFSDASMRFALARNGLTPAVSKSYGRHFSLGYLVSRAGVYGLGGIVRKVLEPLLKPIIIPIDLGDEFEIYAQKKAY